MNAIEWLRIIIIGVIEGITEWLPISSTGHMILLESIWPSTAKEIMSPEFWSVFLVVIQLGAVLAVATLFFHRLNPLSPQKTPSQKQETWRLWGKVLIGCLPAAIAGLLLDDWMDEHLYNSGVVAAMLILYGLVFVLLEYIRKGKKPTIRKSEDLSYRVALLIGLIQILSLVPGTSRSGVTIIGAMLIGCSRYLAAEFTFFLAIPVMLGAGGLKLLKYIMDGQDLSGTQIAVMAMGMIVAYVVSLFCVRFLMNYVKKRDFRPFGYYRIALGIVVLLYFWAANFS